MRHTRLFLAAVLVALIGGAFVYTRVRAERDAGRGTASAGSAHAQAAALARGQAPIAVITAAAEKKDVPVTEDAVGWVEPIATVAVRPRIDGVIVEQPVSEGRPSSPATCSSASTIARCRRRVAKDQAAIAKDQAALDQAKADLKRDQALVGRNDVVTEQQLGEQQALVRGLTASIAIDQATLRADQVQLGYTTITAPIAGRVGVVNQTLGNFVRAADQAPLLTITQMAPVRVSFAVPERDLDAFRAALGFRASRCSVEVFAAGSDKPLATGKLTFINSTVDTASGTVTVKAEFANADGALWPGEYLTVRTELGVIAGRHRRAARRRAAERQGHLRLSWSSRTTRVASTPVVLADTRGDSAIISAGVKPGDRVVVEGQLHLSDGAARERSDGRARRRPRRTQPHEHLGALHPPPGGDHPARHRADRGRRLRLSIPAGRGAARRRFSRRHGLRAASRRLARHHGELGGDAADQAVLADPGDRHDDREERPGLDLDRHPVRPQPRHRPGGGRRAGGDRPHAPAIAGEHDDAARATGRSTRRTRRSCSSRCRATRCRCRSSTTSPRT